MLESHLYVDLSQAFDSTSHKNLWIKLSFVGVSSHFINVIKNLYKKAKTKIRTTLGFTGLINILKGVLQGESVSPTLFTMHLEEIVKILKERKVDGINLLLTELIILLYADDITLMATNQLDLQKQIHILKELFDSHLLKLKLTKTKVMIFSKSGKVPKSAKLFWGGNRLEIVNSYTYLGVTFFSNGIFNRTKDIFIKKSKLAINNRPCAINLNEITLTFV